VKFSSILETIGHTPVVRLNHFTEHQAAELWCKLESFNPGGSVKDRPALNMIEDAERRGVLNPGDTIVEPTSGNTGIGLAMVAAAKGYRGVFVMAEDMSEERKRILKAYGGEVVLTPADKGTVGAIDEAKRLAQENGWFFVGQHFNPANPASHESTADEIFDDFGTDLYAIILTTGTGGTISGLSTYLKPRMPGVKIIATEPADSPILSRGIACMHKIMGTAPGFIPKTLDTSSYEEIIPITTQEAYGTARLLAEKEGIFSGISCGAAVAGMLKVAAREDAKDKKLLALLADTGERYLSTDLWAVESS
jgi:cysteine synthase A